MPNFLAQLNNPEMQSLVTNPRAMSAMLQIQQGMEQLRQVAPSFASTYVFLLLLLLLLLLRHFFLFRSSRRRGTVQLDLLLD